jgi:hypothetical protein
MEFGDVFRKAVLSVVANLFKPNTVCIVKSVDKVANTCDVVETGSNYEIKKVRLLSVENSFVTQLAVYPKVGSVITIGYLLGSRNKATVINYSEVDEIWLRGNQFGGIVKADVLKEEIEKTNEVVSFLRTSLLAWTPVTGDGGLALKTILNAPGNDLSSKNVGDFSSIKNEKVLHG